MNTVAKETKFPVPQPNEGEAYIGTIIYEDGTGNHIFMLPNEDVKNWDDGMEWAKRLGGDLPDRVEWALLYKRKPDQFKKGVYWSNTQYADYSYGAWSQHFRYGDQNYYYKSSECRVRAVRREFSDSVI